MSARIIICGGRNYADIENAERVVTEYTNSHFGEYEEIEIVSGACDRGTLTYTREDGTKVYGADGLGERIAAWNNWKVKPFPADWKKHGKAAGPIRNREMGAYATHCIAFHDGISRGTADMIKVAKDNNLIVKEVKY
jgi:hypothetical protein